jgi:hypothetical protein
MAKHQVFILSDWKIVLARRASGADSLCVSGCVSGNPRFAEGELVTTSAITTYRLEFDALIVVTRKGSEYQLGKPSPAEPFAAQRLLRRLAGLSLETQSRDMDIQTRAARPAATDLEDELLTLIK